MQTETVPVINNTNPPSAAARQEFLEKYQSLTAELHKVIVGQDEIMKQLLVVLFARGHALIIGVPGLAKTLMVKTLAATLHWDYKRIQFTPDLMPSDIIGTEVLQADPESGLRRFQFIKGPIFANLILADEINRTPPKTQSALLEAMQELTVTAGGQTFTLPPPFLVVATQNPIEQEGTYPLPEAQLDRFMLSLKIGYPQRAEEIAIVSETTSRGPAQVEAVFSREEVMQIQQMIRSVPVSQHVLEYAVDLAAASRPQQASAPAYVKKYVEWGAGPRASQCLILCAKCLAFLSGAPAPSCDDVRKLARAVLQHRIIPNYHATGEGISSEQIIDHLIANVKERDYRAK